MICEVLTNRFAVYTHRETISDPLLKSTVTDTIHKKAYYVSFLHFFEHTNFRP